MTFHVHVTSKAERQLAEAALWWAKHRNAEQAAQWLERFESAITSLASNALQHSVARENDAFEVTLRQLLFGINRKITHRALFTIVDDAVSVVAIRHVSQRDLTPDDLRD